MSGLATAQTRIPAREVEPGWFLYSYERCLWEPIAQASTVGDVTTFRIDGRTDTVTVRADDAIDVCAP